MFAFRAMGTEVTVTAPGPEEAVVAARVLGTFEEAERRFSRFRDDSELAALNRESGPFVASEPLFRALTRARVYVRMTGGIFNPGVGGALVALGYDRSCAPGALDRASEPSRPREASLLEVTLEPATRTVRCPPHVQLDLGGMIKGATVDAAAVHLPGDGAIDAGGDAVLRGRGPTGEPWWVDVEDPTDASRTLATLAVTDRAVATSAANRRRWRAGPRVAHHLIDPRTGASAETDLLQVTVLAPHAEVADVLAKTAFVLGEERGRRFLERWPAVGAVLVLRDRALRLVGDVDVREARRG